MRFLHERPIVPVGAVPQKNAQNKRKNINKYTVKGRELIHKKLTINTDCNVMAERNLSRARSTNMQTTEYHYLRLNMENVQLQDFLWKYTTFTVIIKCH